MTVDEETYIECEACVDICPEVFAMASDKAVVKMSEIPENFMESL